jgi:glutaredoxin 3
MLYCCQRPTLASPMTRVRMYSTQTCPFCLRAKALLQQRGVKQIDEIRVDLQPAERDAMIRLTGRRTVPQIFIGETHVGGCDDLFALDQRGALAPLLAAR